MTTRTKRRTGTFTATGDDGRQHAVHIYTEFISAGSIEGVDEIEGMKELQLADGTRVNRLGKGEYEALTLPKLKLRSNDPNAP
jgi:hypothetical protein